MKKCETNVRYRSDEKQRTEGLDEEALARKGEPDKQLGKKRREAQRPRSNRRKGIQAK